MLVPIWPAEKNTDEPAQALRQNMCKLVRRKSEYALYYLSLFIKGLTVALRKEPIMLL